MAKLTIVSDNPDFCGTWNKDEVVTEMKELGIEAPEDQWLDYIFDRNFECDSLADTVNFLKSGLCSDCHDHCDDLRAFNYYLL